MLPLHGLGDETQTTCNGFHPCRGGLQQHGCAVQTRSSRQRQLICPCPEVAWQREEPFSGLHFMPPIPAVPASGEQKQLHMYLQHKLLYPALPTNLILSLSFHSGVWSTFFPVLKISAFIMKSAEKWDPLYSQFCWNRALKKVRDLGKVLQIHRKGL